MTISQAQQQLTAQLSTIYDKREAANITDWVIEHLTGLKKIDRIVQRDAPLPKMDLLQQYTTQLLAHRPVQYVLNEAWFAGMAFFVNEEVLIPRPETEELVEWVVAEAGDGVILDIGTGSGCIPVTLKKKLPGAQVYSCDVSAGALDVAGKNAHTHQTNINFIQADFLDREAWPLLPEADIVVSNPPYIPENNRSAMQANVLQYEPHLALFVANNDPLVFYKAIAEFAHGRVYVEIHEDLGAQTKALFEEKGFSDVELRKDMQGKDRMLKAVRRS